MSPAGQKLYDGKAIIQRAYKAADARKTRKREVEAIQKAGGINGMLKKASGKDACTCNPGRIGERGILRSRRNSTLVIFKALAEASTAIRPHRVALSGTVLPDRILHRI